MSFLDVVKNKWPVAYAESPNVVIPLVEHLNKTALLSKELFTSRIRVLNNIYNKYKCCMGSIEEILYISGLLHDYGKLSNYYLKKRYIDILEKKPNAKLTFYLHEYVTPLLLLELAYREIENPDQNLALVNACRVIARVIARHHSAIPYRHPVEFTTQIVGGKDYDTLKMILKYICMPEARAINTLDSLKIQCSYLNGELCIELINKLKNMLMQDCQSYRMNYYLTHLNALKAFDQLFCPQERGFDIYDSYKVVSVLSGMIIVADNIVSSYCESRLTDDEATPLFVNTWRRELIYKLNKIKELHSDVLGVCQW